VSAVVRSMDEAVRAATTAALPGDIVLLSPGCASFGLFRDEFDRGDQFRRAVAALCATEVETR
jgi:UDP-N-acetylmuramoylalanine--D-glutamate ligase